MSKMFYYDSNKHSYQPVYAQALNFNNDILNAEEIINKINQAGKVDSVNGKQGKVKLVAKDIPINQWTSLTIEDMLSQLDNDIISLSTKKADKSYVDKEVDVVADLTLDFWDWLDNDKADKRYVDNMLNNKANKNDIKRTNTIIIANYDSHKNSKKGADIIINKGENASKKINDAIQSLKGIGGEVKLMEGNYNLEYGIAVNVDGVHLTGIPNATILVQNKNWKNNPYNGGRKDIIDTKSDIDNLEITISNLHVKGARVSYSNGFYCTGCSAIINCVIENSGSNGLVCGDSSILNNCISNNSSRDGFFCANYSTINNCISNNSDGSGFNCRDSSILNNCISNNSGRDGFFCWVYSTAKNCISNNSSHNGFACTGYSTIINCVSENSGEYGFNCKQPFRGVCSFNILKSDKMLNESLATVEYNIIQKK